MKVGIVGGTGDLGMVLTRELVGRGDEVVWFTRDAAGNAESAVNAGVADVVAFDQDDPEGGWVEGLGRVDAVVLLAGSPISDRWNPRTRARIVASRVDLTRRVVDACEVVRGEAVSAHREPKPTTLVTISGVGVYGDRGDTLLDESEPPGQDWLARVAALWERQAMRAATLGMRVVVLRTGLVLDDRGLLPRMALPMRLFAGGPVGSGKQYVPWIHRDDVARSFAHALDTESMRGVYNNCAPEQVTMERFAAELGRELRRPSWMRVPESGLRIVLGPGAPTMVMSQRADASRLLSTGFEFRYPELVPALDDLLHRNRRGGVDCGGPSGPAGRREPASGI